MSGRTPRERVGDAAGVVLGIGLVGFGVAVAVGAIPVVNGVGERIGSPVVLVLCGALSVLIGLVLVVSFSIQARGGPRLEHRSARRRRSAGLHADDDGGDGED